MFEIDRVKAFDQSRSFQMRGHHFARSSFVIVQFREFSVALRIIIPGIDDNFAPKTIRGERAELAERYGNQYNFAKACGLLNRRRFHISAKFGNQRFKAFPTPRVAERDFMSGTNKKTRRISTNVSRTNDSYFHLRFLSYCQPAFPGNQSWLMPPSATISVPSRNEESELARKSAVLAISSGRPNRFIGICSLRFLAVSSSSAGVRPSRLRIGVLMGPGLRALTRMPRPT